MGRTAEGAELRESSADGSLACLLVLVLIAAVVFLYDLGGRPLEDWDEAIYAQVSKEIVQSGDWLTLHWGFQNWFEKPPLLMWTTAIFYRLFGVTEFWSRAASAFSGIGVIALTYLLGKHLYSVRVGLFAGLILLTSYHFVSFSRFGTTDVMLTLFTYLAIYAFIRQQQQEQHERAQICWYVACAACALAVLVKGAGGWIAPATIISALLFDWRRFDTLRTRHFWFGIILALIIVAPWHILMYFKHGQTFVAEYAGYHVLSRIATPLEGHAPGYLFYAGKLVDGFFPWCLLLPFAVISSVRENLRGESRSRLLLTLAALVFGVYTLVQSKLVWYIIPIYPALALLVAAFVAKIYLSLRQRRKLKFALAASGVLLLLIGGVYSFLLIRLTHHTSETSLAQIAKLAASHDAADREPLLLFSDTEALTRPAAHFYSNRPLRQVYLTSEPRSPRARRYENPEILSSVVGASPVRVILNRADAEKLSAEYELKIEAAADPFIYAFIKRRNVPAQN